MIWHSATTEETLREIGSGEYTGLSEKEAKQRLSRYGKNKVKDKNRRGFVQILWEQLKNPFLLILLITAAVWLITSLLLQKPSDAVGALVLIGVTLLGVIVGMLKEWWAESTLDSARALSQPSAKVLRDGQRVIVPAEDLVPGDILLLFAGDYVPADARLLKSDLLRCDESLLTGEPVSVEKNAAALFTDITPLAERQNMVYTGCSVTDGSAIAVVVATGMATERAKIAAVVEDSLRITTPLQVNLKDTTKNIAMAAVVVALLVFVLGVILTDGDDFLSRLGNAFLTCCALAAAVVPQSLAATVTVVLAAGLRRLVRKKMMVQSLSAVETLGKTSVICTDKTGTLTQNHMTVTRIYQGDTFYRVNAGFEPETQTKDLLYMAALCCDAQVVVENGKDKAVGDHTEAGIVWATGRYTGTDKATLDSMYPRLCQLPFDSERKLKTSVNMIDGKPVAVVKGAPDVILSRCGGIDPKPVTEAARAMANDALRVLGVAFKPLLEAPSHPTEELLEHDLIFGGLIGLIDPPIPETEKALADAKNAGIRVVMMTGDHASTAASTAKNMGILEENNGVITDDELQSLTDEELADLVERFAVYVRVSPENKIRVVKALQAKGYVVTITGDSAADASVLRAADVGCAMGSGTDVAKNAAHVTVKDDRFDTMMKGVGIGRAIYQNIANGVRYTLGGILGLAITMLFGLIFWQAMPMNGVQIMWQSLLVMTLPVLALGLEPPSKGLMHQPPVTTLSFFGKKAKIYMMIHGVLLGLFALIAYGIGRGTSPEVASAMAFGVLGFGQLFCAFSSRSLDSRLALSRHSFNFWLVLSVVIAALFMLPVMTWSGLASVFGMTAPEGSQITFVVIGSLVPLLGMEIAKLPSLFIKK